MADPPVWRSFSQSSQSLTRVFRAASMPRPIRRSVGADWRPDGSDTGFK